MHRFSSQWQNLYTEFPMELHRKKRTLGLVYTAAAVQPKFTGILKLMVTSSGAFPHARSPKIGTNLNGFSVLRTRGQLLATFGGGGLAQIRGTFHFSGVFLAGPSSSSFFSRFSLQVVYIECVQAVHSRGVRAHHALFVVGFSSFGENCCLKMCFCHVYLLQLIFKDFLLHSFRFKLLTVFFFFRYFFRDCGRGKLNCYAIAVQQDGCTFPALLLCTRKVFPEYFAQRFVQQMHILLQ